MIPLPASEIPMKIEQRLLGIIKNIVIALAYIS
jgi:hypothetical protein